VFLREHRHELFSEEFQAELAQAYADKPKGQPPVPPAQLALATILQAYAGVSDDEVIEATVMDRRWQLALDCLDADGPPFSKGTLVGFRKRLIRHNLDRRLVDRTVELATATGGSGARALRAALDSSPLWGAGRVEDTINLMGHALRKALGVIAVLQGRAGRGDRRAGRTSGGADAVGLQLEGGAGPGLGRPGCPGCGPGRGAGVPGCGGGVRGRRAGQRRGRPRLPESGPPGPRPGRGPDRTGAGAAPRGGPRPAGVSVEDAQMRHGRKSRSLLFDGYKRHVLTDLDTGLIPAVGITPANVPEATVTDDITADLDAAGLALAELHIDRAYLSSDLVRDRGSDLAIFCKAWRVRNTTGRYAKTEFALDFAAGQLTCPAGVAMPFQPGKTVRFPKTTCAACPLQRRCTTSSNGRSVSIHPGEALLAELRQRQQSPAGRAKLRERVQVEHTLAHVGHWQGRRARYRGTGKNLFDLRRVAVVHNLHVIARQPAADNDQLAA
jgi:transposase